MIIESIIDFLRDIPPFQFLNDHDVMQIASKVSIRFFQKDTFILKQDDFPSNRLIVIKKGGVKLVHRFESTDETFTEYYGEADIIDFSLLSEIVRFRVDAISTEDTICYSLRKEYIHDILNHNDMVSEYLQKSFIRSRINKRLQGTQNSPSLSETEGELLFTITAGEVASQPVITATPDISIHEAAEIMDKMQISSLVISETPGIPAGILTDKDLRSKVVARNKDLTEPVSTIMNRVPIRVDARESCVETLQKMIRHNVRHLLVIDNGKLKGIITEHDIMQVQRITPVFLVREIERQHSVDGLARLVLKIDDSIHLLIKNGVKVFAVMNIISDMNDRFVKKIIELAEKKYGHPPLPYCWVGIGSCGRKEEGLSSMHQNSIIYADPVSPLEAAAALRFFENFTSFINQCIVKCKVSGDLPSDMVSYTMLCQPIGMWKKYLLGVISDDSVESSVDSLSLLDFRSVYGDSDLAFDLRNYLNLALGNKTSFLKVMSDSIIKDITSLEVETINGKQAVGVSERKCLKLIIDMVRLFALEFKIRETSTLERISRLISLSNEIAEFASELERAFELISLLAIYDRIESISREDFIDKRESIDSTRPNTLKGILPLLLNLRDLIAGRYERVIV